MIEKALLRNQPNTNTSSTTPTPPETCLALLAFFRHEYPLGGTVESRFIRFFPLLCDRIFGGPILLLNTQQLIGKNTAANIPGGGSSGNVSGNSRGDLKLTNEQLDLLKDAWLNQRSRWIIPSSAYNTISSSSSSSNGPLSNSSTASASAGANISSGSSRLSSISSSNGSSNIRTHASSGINSGISSSNALQSLANDPLVQLLSPSSSVSSLMNDPTTESTLHQHQQQPIELLLNTFFFHILESSYTIPTTSIISSTSSATNLAAGVAISSSSLSSSMKQMKNLRISFPFLELSQNMQHSYIQHILLHQQQQQNNQIQQQQVSQPTTISVDNQTSSDILLQKMHYSPLVQKELIQILRLLYSSSITTTRSTNNHTEHNNNGMMIHDHEDPRLRQRGTNSTNTTPTNNNEMNNEMKPFRSPILGGGGLVGHKTSPTFHITTRISDSSLSSLQLPPTQQQQHHQMHHHGQHFTFDSHHNHHQQEQQSMNQLSRMMATTSNLSSFQNIKVIIDAWEYYMISFFRHAIYSSGILKHTIMNHVPSNMPSSNTLTRTYTTSGGTLYGERIYYHLFKSYCEYYLPHIFDHKLYKEIQYQNSIDVEMKEFSTVYEYRSECWIRLMMEYFLDYDHVYTKTRDGFDHLSPALKREFMNGVGSRGDGDKDKDMDGGRKKTGLLACSYELATLLPIPIMIGERKVVSMTMQEYNAPSKTVQRCIRSFIDHLIRDPSIRQKCHAGGNSGTNKMDQKQHDNTTMNMDGDWPLSKGQTIVQPSFFNYVRTVLRYGPIHVKYSSFYAALEMWLNWLEPWNVKQHKKSGSSIENARELFHSVSDRVASSRDSSSSLPKRRSHQYSTTYEKPKPTSPSTYTPAWESYVAANLHLYIIPLAIFLRRSREFDFSAEGFQWSITYVQKVLRVFSPKLVKTLEKLLNHHNNVSENESSTNKRLYAMVQNHEHNLGEYCPPRPNTMVSGLDTSVWSLEMLQQDMHTMLEEIVLQHRKTMSEQDFVERFASHIQGLLFQEGVQAEENTIQKVIQKAKIIVQFPRRYEVFPDGNGHDGSDAKNNTLAQYNDTSSIFSPEREQNGFITTKGRYQILEGSKICNAMDVAFIGDPMYSRVKDYEVEILVKLAIYLSEKMNERFGFISASSAHLHGDKDEDNMTSLLKEQNEAGALKFRINLRPLADTRNWIFLFVALRIVWKALF